MTRFLQLAAGLLCVGLFLTAVSCGPEQGSSSAGGKEAIPWRHDFAAAQSESASTHKPVLAYFTATWCGPCQTMKKTTWSDPKVESALRDYVPVKIDIDENSKLAAQYHVDGIPTYMILDAQGKPTRNDSGLRSPDEFLAWLKGS